MPTADIEQLREIRSFPSLVRYLRDELDWPVDGENVDDLTFDYSADELGFDAKHAVKVREVKQLRPLVTGQPWGIFWVSFEKKRLPMVVLRRILGNLITKTRASANKATRPSWQLHDLLFISSYGEEEHRNISFAHFSESAEGHLPVLRVLGWDDQNSIMHLDRVANRLQTNLRWPDAPAEIEKWRSRWFDAFTDRYREAIQSADVLIEHLARLASNIRQRVADVLDAEAENGPMRRLFAAVRALLIHDMTERSFADMYAQTVSYGLLSASFSRRADLTPQNLVQLTAVSNPFLENLLESLFRLNRGKFHFDVDEVGINDVLDLLRNTNIQAIKAAFNDLNPAEDPVIRFYEGFLRAYDSEQRIKRGVFFTPRPVVSYIVRSVHELLQTEFGLEDGLASTATWADMLQKFPDLQPPKDVKPDDPFVLILDIATGTATFLFECLELIERTMKTKWARALGKRHPESRKAWEDAEVQSRWNDYVPKHLLPRLYGFEVMMAPYAIAHLKLALKLGETGYQFREGDRLHIYLTNTLEEASPHADTKLADLFGPLAREAQEVNRIKRTKRFTVVIGNPPYAGLSANMSEEAGRIIEPYKYINGVHFGERKHWLHDDYVKFFRFSETRVTASGVGVLGLITNHAFYDNPSFNGMRWNLLKSFDHLRLLDLHGNTMKREKDPDGSEDKNVFDIQQGVAISLFSKLPSQAERVVTHGELWGTRERKYAVLSRSQANTLAANALTPSPTFYFFVPRVEENAAEYESSLRLNEIFGVFAGGFLTARDHFVIDFDRTELLARIEAFADASVSDAKIRETYFAGCGSDKYPDGDTRGWKVPDARKRLRKDPDWKSHVYRCLYRPFDVRWIYWTEGMVDWPRPEVNGHLLNEGNLALVFMRQVASGDGYSHFLVSRLPVDNRACYSNKGIMTFAPLHLHESSTRGHGELSFDSTGTHANFTPAFTAAIRAKLSNAAAKLTPEDIFHYAYAVFHSPGYRRRYAEFLKIDFPRLPLTGNLELFRALARLGGELVALHLLESPKLNAPLTEYLGGRAPVVEKPDWSKNTVWLDKAQTIGFKGVREDVWNFHIGGYQVCEKWLKDRKGRTLSAADREHYQKLIVALSETIQLMREVDAVIEKSGGWPLN